MSYLLYVYMSIQNIGKIARIKIAEDKISDFQKKLDSVVSWISEAKSVDSKNHSPMLYVNISKARTYNNDTNIKTESTESILFNNKIQSASSIESKNDEKSNYFKTILVVE